MPTENTPRNTYECPLQKDCSYLAQSITTGYGTSCLIATKNPGVCERVEKIGMELPSPPMMDEKDLTEVENFLKVQLGLNQQNTIDEILRNIRKTNQIIKLASF